MAIGDRVHAGLPLARNLRDHGPGLAVIAGDERITYDELADRVEAVASDLFIGDRRLVLITASFDLDTLVHLLAAFSTANPVFLAPADDPAKLKQWVQHYDPDVIITRHGDQLLVHERRAASAHDLHHELALLISTSGSTGSPKLVRLSATNVQSNAEQIATTLGLTADDRALTTLPLAYAYGFSVISSHLHAGATVVLNATSIVDECFWDTARRHDITTFAGVPYTYELLDRLGPEHRLGSVPSLRQITVSGGHLPAADVARYVDIAQAIGIEFVVMYGQSEATARISIARMPDLIAEPATVGRPLEGSSVHLEHATADPGGTTHGTVDPRDDLGELVFTGPNMMLGYAHGSADLARGQMIDQLRTGDLARFDGSGRLIIVGREQRFSKIYGLRVDLQRVEDTLHADGISAHIVNDDALLVVVAEHPDTDHVTERVRQFTALPARAVTTVFVGQLPRTAVGKLDHQQLRRIAHDHRLALDVAAEAPNAQASPLRTAQIGAASEAEAIREVMARCLGRPDATVEDSFASLGGDSLSHVEMSVRLEGMLDTLPPDWPSRTATELAALVVPAGAGQIDAPDARRHATWWRYMDSTVVLRALAILAVVALHIGLPTVQGGAYLLLVVAGYNVARFLLSPVERRTRVRNLVRATTAIALPSAVWLTGVVLLSDQYDWPTATFTNSIFGTTEWSNAWRYWFVEALIMLMVGVTVLAALPLFDRLERRQPFAMAIALVGCGLLIRFHVVIGEPFGAHIYTPLFASWLFALGWAV